jgi:predicted RNA binding protein YcfA (HicA-like mRNA interferase family)
MLRDGRKIIRRLRQDGFDLVSVRGDHHKFRHPVARRIVIVAHPESDLPPGTVQAIYRQAGWPKD